MEALVATEAGCAPVQADKKIINNKTFLFINATLSLQVFIKCLSILNYPIKFN